MFSLHTHILSKGKNQHGVVLKSVRNLLDWPYTHREFQWFTRHFKGFQGQQKILFKEKVSKTKQVSNRLNILEFIILPKLLIRQNCTIPWSSSSVYIKSLISKSFDPLHMFEVKTRSMVMYFYPIHIPPNRGLCFPMSRNRRTIY